ncbi:tRNA (Cytosine(34)-C(5))-methyltransferase [Durusdinium trenchii]|uniref:tRNA (Cytosine(34)-C(5))-methyltransferase n=1 Tax=Durusdinium trenchii TaxID=1381693 RepID=A0ABP0QCF5_9DINO
MHWVFDILGATDSCQYGFGVEPITSKPGYREDCTFHETPIRFHNYINGEDILRLRKDAAFKGGLRGVMIIRDPFEMVASAYCYHHRGAELGTGLAPANITEIGPEEGVPIMAGTMLQVVRRMTSAYAVAKPEVLAVRFEKLTKSSQDFDNTVREILTFLFRNEITEKQTLQILNATAVEGVNRGLQGFSELPGANQGYNHTNDEEDMAVARKALHLIPDNILAEYQQHRKFLGYGS